MNIDFLAIFKWIAWGLISVVFYHFFLKEFIQFEIIIDNRFGGSTPGAVQLLKDGEQHGSINDIGELEFYKQEAAIQSDNVRRLIEELDRKERKEQKQKSNQPSANFLRQQAVLTKELNSLRDGIDYLRSQAIEKFKAIENFLQTPPKKHHEEAWANQLRDVFKDFQEELLASAGSNLLVSDVRTTYSKAQSTCREMGMNLVTIASKEKLQEVINTINDLKRWDIWIGLNRLGRKDESYAWDSGYPLTYTNWDSGQPNRRDPWGKGGEEACTIMWSTGKWHDYNCNVIAYFICESAIITNKDIITQDKVHHDPTQDVFASGDYDYDDGEL